MDPDTPLGMLDPGVAGVAARPFPDIDNGFLAAYRVRFDEAGPNGRARSSTLLRYAQDIAWRHSEQLGFDREWYASRGLGWVVRGVDLELHLPIPMGHTIRVATAVVGHRRIWARRLAEGRLADGRLATRVTTDWVLLDGRSRIVRIPADFGVAFVNPEIDHEIIRVGGADGAPVHEARMVVRGRDIDPLDHVNNAVYVDWLDEALGQAGLGVPDGEPSRLRLEYLASAARGDEVDVALHGRVVAWQASIRRGDGLELLRAAGGTLSVAGSDREDDASI